MPTVCHDTATTNMETNQMFGIVGRITGGTGTALMLMLVLNDSGDFGHFGIFGFQAKELIDV